MSNYMSNLVDYLIIVPFALLGVSTLVLVVKTAILVIDEARKKSSGSK